MFDHPGEAVMVLMEQEEARHGRGPDGAWAPRIAASDQPQGAAMVDHADDAVGVCRGR